MSIKSQTPGIASDIPLMEKQRKPIYKTKNKTKSFGEGDQIDNVSSYVRKNMARTVKPRGSESR